MKKIVLAIFTMLFVSTAVFAQSDLQVLAVVKYNKSESITLKQLKKRVASVETPTHQKLNIEQKKELLNTMIEEKLIMQAAQKEGMSVPDSMVDQYFETVFLPSMLGLQVPVTLKQFEDIVKQTYPDMSADSFLKANLGLTVNEVKENLKTNLYMQNYVLMKSQDELASIIPTNDQIKMFFQDNKSAFVWNDMVQMLRLDVPYGSDKKASRAKCNELRNKVIDKKVTIDNLISGSRVEGSGYMAQKALIKKSQEGLISMGYSNMTLENFYKLLGQGVGYVSDIMETEDAYSFVSIIKKYDAKMLGLNDPVLPEQNVTVYDYIRNILTQQMQGAYLQEALVKIASELNTPQNVEMKKTDSALDELLNY